MSQIVFANNAKTSLAGSITNVATTANLSAGSGALFASPGTNQFFVGTFTDAATGLINEIVHVTGISGDTITMVRAQEGTSAQNWNAGDLFANRWTAGQATVMVQSGAGTPYGVVGEARGLAGVAGGSSSLASWTIQEIIAETALGGTGWKGSSLSLSFNGGTVGANGMDIGSMPTSGDLSVYAIYNPASNTWACLGTLRTTSNGPIYAGSHLPSGYTASVLIWAGVTDGSAHFMNFVQRGRFIWSTAAGLFLNATVANNTFTSASLSASVPACATACGGNFSVAPSSGSNNLFFAGDVNGTGAQQIGAPSNPDVGDGSFNQIPLITAQTLFYRLLTATNAAVQGQVNSYTI